jgi:hypothetical protein
MESSQAAPTQPRRIPEVIHNVLIGCSPLQDVIAVSCHSVRKGKPEVSLGHEGSPAVFDDEGVLVSELCPQDFNFRPGLACDDHPGDLMAAQQRQGGPRGVPRICLMVQQSSVELCKDKLHGTLKPTENLGLNRSRRGTSFEEEVAAGVE